MQEPWILIGMLDSPFVRRVAVSLNLLELPFEHRAWSVGKDFERIREFNPLGRVPTLVTPGVASPGVGTPAVETLIDSGAILDFIDDHVGEERALLPRTGAARRAALRSMAIASGAAEKGVQQIYEKAFRPEATRHEPWVMRCRTQMHGALEELERAAAARDGAWLVGGALTQADVTVGCVFKFLSDALRIDPAAHPYPALDSLSRRLEALPAFRDARADFAAPG